MKTIISLAAVTLLISLKCFSAGIMPGSGPGSSSDHPFPPGERMPQNDWPTNMVHPHNEMTTNLPPLTNNWSNATNHWRTNDWSSTNGDWPHTSTNKWSHTNDNWPPVRTNKWSSTNGNWLQARTNLESNPPSETH